MSRTDNRRTIVWHRLQNKDTGVVVEISFEQEEDELYVPEDPWDIIGCERIELWN